MSPQHVEIICVNLQQCGIIICEEVVLRAYEIAGIVLSQSEYLCIVYIGMLLNNKLYTCVMMTKMFSNWWGPYHTVVD